MAGLGDILSAAATGQNPNYQDIQASAALKGATFQDTMAQVPLRGAQTAEALQNADKARLEALGLSRRQAAIDKLREAQATGQPGAAPAAPSLADLLDIDSNAQQATAAGGNLQEQGFQRTLGNPAADPSARLAASSALTHKMETPFVALPPESVDLRNLPPPGAAPNGTLSQIGEATVGGKNASANLANAKAGQLTSTDNSVDPNEMAYLAHVFNTSGAVPSFGMGQSALRQYFLKAAYLDASGQPINASTLGIPAAKLGNHFQPPAAAGAAPSTATPGAAPAPAAAAPGAAPAATTPPISPTDAANNTVSSRINTKATQSEVSNAQKMLGVVQAQSYTAHQSYQLALGLAQKLADQRGPDGSPIINKLFLDWKNGVKGDPVSGEFVHELTVAHDEYAKIVSGAMGASGITDKGREAADKLFNQNMNLDTLQGIGHFMDLDMGNRRMGYVNTIQGAHAGITHPVPGGVTAEPGAPAAVAPPAAAAPVTIPPAAAAALKEGKITTFGNGQQWTLQGGKPVQVH